MYRVFGSGLVSWRGNGTSVGVGFYDSHRGVHEPLRNQPGRDQVRGVKAEVRLPNEVRSLHCGVRRRIDFFSEEGWTG